MSLKHGSFSYSKEACNGVHLGDCHGPSWRHEQYRLCLQLLYISYRMLRRSAEAGSTSVLAAALSVLVFIDVPINYMANRWFRTNHPQPVTLDDPRMKFALMTTMIAFSGIWRSDCLVSILCRAHCAEDRGHTRSENGSACFCRAAGSSSSPAAGGTRSPSPACLYV